MKPPIYFDTETCGFHGPIVLIQYAVGDGPTVLWEPWRNPIRDTIELIAWMCNYEGGVVAFNLAFDWFHICQMYTTLVLMENWDEELQYCIDEYANNEDLARNGLCLKPQHAHDVFLHARKTEYQSLMDRKDIRIRRVPTKLAWDVAEILNERVELKDVYFARKQDPKKRFGVYDITNDLGEDIPDFKDVVLKFAPSSGLKALAVDALGVDDSDLLKFGDIDTPKKAQPVELGYAPFATAIGSSANWKGAWPDKGKITVHIDHWAFNKRAREYATRDVIYTRGLYEYFGSPEMDDDDSVLAASIGAVRWRGYAVDIPGIKKLRNAAMLSLAKLNFNHNSPKVCRRYLEQKMTDLEIAALKGSTKATVLEEIATWREAEVCNDCGGMSCDKCNEGLVESDKPHPAAERAQIILDARHAGKEIENYDKLLVAGRFHASFKVIGTLSGRMAGADKLNPQGIKRGKEVRSRFPLAFGDLELCGGDFAGFEVVLMDAAYKDPDLRKELESGKKIHALFGMHLFPGMSYDEIVATKDEKENIKNIYDRSKRGVFGIAYGGNEHTLQRKVGISEEGSIRGFKSWTNKYKIWATERQKIQDMFCSMTQPGGLGTKVVWKDPAEYIESLFGFRRYFHLENRITKILFELANDPPKEWTYYKIKVVRRDREQGVGGATRSALFAAAFNVQASNMRAAGNHVIQSSGATVTKGLQRHIWNLQPAGINVWHVQPMNVHDEIMVPALPHLRPVITKLVNEFVESVRPEVPLIEIDWGEKIDSWAEK
jgi:hypothetical protein